MKPSDKIRAQIFEIIENQIKDGNPPETLSTTQRLEGQGFSDFEVKQLIGQCVAIELFTVLKHNKPFDEKRYVKNLKNLPEEPVD